MICRFDVLSFCVSSYILVILYVKSTFRERIFDWFSWLYTRFPGYIASTLSFLLKDLILKSHRDL